jgi:hypothetical protein
MTRWSSLQARLIVGLARSVRRWGGGRRRDFEPRQYANADVSRGICHIRAVLRQILACGPVMTRESSALEGDLRRAGQAIRALCRGPGQAQDLTGRVLRPHARKRQVERRSRTAGLESIDRVKEPVRLAPASTAHTSLSRPTRDEQQGPQPRAHIAQERGQRNRRTTCSRVPTIRPSSDDPPRSGACADGR